MYRPDEVDVAKKKSESLSNYVYEAIKKKIINGELAPGNSLMDRALAAEMGVSRTPIRDALKRLSQEGWVLWREHKGIVVSEVNSDDEYQLFLLREMIEPFIVRKIITTKRPQVLAGQLVVIADEMESVKDNPVEFMKKDMQFHTAIIEFLGVTKLGPLWEKICDDMTRLVVQSVRKRRPPDEIMEEHRILIESFWRADLETALACIGRHCRLIVEIYHNEA
ncbi:MAG: GntR family transcriptional regulator [Synergistaceae bacterium]|nr:GntR family transcriptional regulator [Synergistaceae bacterium]